MKGLLIKDIKLMGNMKNSLLLILLISIVMTTYIKDASFLIMYLGMIGTTFATSTLSYDEFDNGYSFLLSLPVTRKGYVMEKYGFGLLLSGSGWLLGTVLALAAGIVRGSREPLDIIMTSIVLLPAVFFLLAVMIPFRLKFGSEKGRVVVICAAGAAFLVFTVAAEIVKRTNLDLDSIWGKLTLQGAGVMAASLAIGTVILLISYRLSVSIMEKKNSDQCRRAARSDTGRPFFEWAPYAAAANRHFWHGRIQDRQRSMGSSRVESGDAHGFAALLLVCGRLTQRIWLKDMRVRIGRCLKRW